MYITKLEGYIAKLNQEREALLELIKELYFQVNSEFRLGKEEYCLQHGDFYGSNIMHDNDKSGFIVVDWNSVMHTSAYFDIATFIAKHLTDNIIVNDTYKYLYENLNSTQQKNFNYQILISLTKEYKNLASVPPEVSELGVIKDYKSLVESNLITNIPLATRKLNFN